MKGKRKLRQETVQRYQCRDCSLNFTDRKLSNSTYNAKVILEAISNYNLGMNLEDSSKEINKKFHVKTYPRLISSWLARYKEIVPYKRFRQKNREKQEFIENLFEHKQPYLFSYSKQKVERFLNKYFSGLRDYLFSVCKKCPNDLFLEDNSRASQMKFIFSLSNIKIDQKRNFACSVAEFAVKAIKTNYERHELVERFLSINDTATVAVEVPIWLHGDEIPGEIKGLVGEDIEGSLTGHIDILQCRFGLVYVLDYKPNACKERREKVISQLFCYALALSIRTGIWLRNFRCAWFDSSDYYEFSPGEIVLNFLRGKNIKENKILEKYKLNKKAQRYYTSERFNKKHKAEKDEA